MLFDFWTNYYHQYIKAGKPLPVGDEDSVNPEDIIDMWLQEDAEDDDIEKVITESNPDDWEEV